MFVTCARAYFLMLAFSCCTFSLQAGVRVMYEVFSDWYWIIRYSRQAGERLQYLVRPDATNYSRRFQLSAIRLPEGGDKAGTDLRAISRLSWRTQPETTVRFRYIGGDTHCTSRQRPFPEQMIYVNSAPDLTRLAAELFSTEGCRVPPKLEGVHSFPMVLSNMLNQDLVTENLSDVEVGELFSSEGVSPRNLAAQSYYTPGIRLPNYYTYEPEATPTRIQRRTFATSGDAFLLLGSIPHTGGLTVFHWGRDFVIMTRDENNEIIILASHWLLVGLRWFSGGCRPTEQIASPKYWDPDGRDKQINSLPYVPDVADQ